MGSGASRNNKSRVVSVESSNRTTFMDNRFGRPEHSEGQRTANDSTAKATNKNAMVPPAPTTALANTPPSQSTVKATTIQELEVDGLPAKNEERANSPPTPTSLSSRQSSKSVGEELDNLRSELDEVLIGHYYAVTKPAHGVLRTAEIAVLERHNQLQPLPGDYQPIVCGSEEGPGPSHWVRPEELVRQERELLDKMRREQETRRLEEESCARERDTRDKEKKAQEEAEKKALEEAEKIALEEEKEALEEERKPSENQTECRQILTIYDIEDDQDRGDFDVLKFKAVNTPKDETGSDGLDLYSRATYKNYSAKTKTSGTDKENRSPGYSLPKTSGAISKVNTDYDETEEALLQSIETEF